MKNSLLLCQQIQKALEKRCETLVSHPKQAISSILNCYHKPIHFTTIKLPDQVITEPNSIKQHIQNHFENWTAHKPINQDLYQNFWKQHYQLQLHINLEWYHSLTQPITTDEVINTINQLPNGKACGPTGISYEMIKHAGPTCIHAITALFNHCLNSNQIPKQWKHSRIYPIPKRNSFDGNLNLTRPISLIEHIRKIYTKIITNRLNAVFTQHSILSPFNYVALPGNSTSIPIHILNNFIEDASCNHKEIWLLSQDMSKAYRFCKIKISIKTITLRSRIDSAMFSLFENLVRIKAVIK